MMLGRAHQSTIAPIWAAAKQLELCPVGTIIRNGCDHRAPAGEGTHLRKVRNVTAVPVEWMPCDPKGVWRLPDPFERWIPIRSIDIFLPVQVVKLGDDEQE